MGTKICRGCEEKLSIGEFCYVESRKRYLSYCRKCMKVKQKEYRSISKNLAQKTARRLRIKYGTTPEEIEILRVKQNNVCAICGKHNESISRGLLIDHDHDTGEIRGLLCSNCNTALGLLNDDISILNKAINYLKR